MRPKKAKGPVAAWNSDKAPKAIISTDEATAAENKSQIQSYDDLRRLTRDLETIADWLEELRSRIDRAHLRFQVSGLEVEEQEALEAEVPNSNRYALRSAEIHAAWNKKGGLRDLFTA